MRCVTRVESDLNTIGRLKNVGVTLLFFLLVIPAQGFSCGIVASETHMESYRKSHVFLHEMVCSGKYTKEILKIKNGFRRQCDSAKKLKEAAVEAYRLNPNTSLLGDLKAKEFYVESTCDIEDSFKYMCKDNYKRGVKCGFISSES